jgi:EmrB/QacA subfamily drug resistance transporter
MVVLDATIVNIALPSAQQDLGFSDDGRQWVITGYALAFGSLLLLGGRLSDFFGRKKLFVISLVGFALASAVGGAAQSLEALLAARVAQGAFGALLAPAALSLLSTTFTAPVERGRAFGIFGAISAAGGAIGLLLGGMLTENLSWRWCLYVNLTIAAVALVGALLYLRDSSQPRRGKLDVPGLVTAVSGLVGIVYGLGNAEANGWNDALTFIPVAVGALLLIAFVIIERRSRHPLLPLRVVLDRNRGAAFLSVAISGAGMFAVFLFLTFYLTTVLEFSPIQTGLSFLPMIGGTTVAAVLSGSVLLPRTGPRPLVALGALVAAGGMAMLTTIGADTDYTTGVMPALIVAGVGFGLIFGPVQNAATSGVESHDAGVASAMVNTSQQIGGSIGTAIFSSLSAAAITNYVAGHADAGPGMMVDASLAGYHMVFWSASGVFVGCAVLAAALFRSGPLKVNPDAEPAVAHV